MKKGLIAAAALGAALVAGGAFAQETKSPETTTTKQETTTTRQEAQPAEQAPVEFVTVTGTVESFEAGKSMTLKQADGSTVTYTINQGSMVPAKLTTGKAVTVRTTKVTTGVPVVNRVTYTTTTTTTKK